MIYCTSEFPDLWLSCSEFTRGYHLRMATPRNHQFRPLGSGAALHLQLPRHAMQGPWEPWALRTHHRMAAVLCHEALWIDFVEIETLWSLQFWVAQPGSKRGWSIHSSCLIKFTLNLHKQITFWCPFGGANPNEMLTLGHGPKWPSQVVWENRLKHRLGYKGEALPHPLRDLCSAPSILHHWDKSRCDLWFESARISLPALGVWNLLNMYNMHGWFYYMIVGDTAFYNAHDKVIAFHSM